MAKTSVTENVDILMDEDLDATAVSRLKNSDC